MSTRSTLGLGTITSGQVLEVDRRARERAEPIEPVATDRGFLGVNDMITKITEATVQTVQAAQASRPSGNYATNLASNVSMGTQTAEPLAAEPGEDEQDNTLLYVLLGVGALIVIALVIWLITIL